MSFTTYPTPADVEALMKSSTYWPSGTSAEAINQIELARIQCVIAAAAARDEWEKFTGWKPFLAGAEYTTRYFSEIDHTGYIDFKTGAVDVQSFSISGNVQTLNSNYFLMPENAIDEGEAVTGIQVGYASAGRFVSGMPRRFAVTARWGRVTYVPGDVWQAVQQKAASIVLTQIPNLQSVESVSMDGFEKSYDVVGIVTQKDLAVGGAGGAGIWGRSFSAISSRWKRVVC
jgi:hypothetical protein